MPIYEYKCKDCEHHYEESFQLFSEAEAQEKDVECPKCDSKNKERLISNSSFQLKGKRWAKDKYGK